MRVCVIGAGLAGLNSARYLNRESRVEELMIYEPSSNIGGTWVYTDKIGTDEQDAPVYSSMYKNLRANLPKQTMELDGHPWPDDVPCFPKADVVLQYIKDFAYEEDLLKYVTYHTLVTNVSLKNGKWQVRTKNFLDKSQRTKEFDAVFVCSGHYSEPDIPTVPGSDLFKGEVIHAHTYRSSEKFKDKNVLVVGLGPSGADISLELKTFARNVYLSHHSKMVSTDLWNGIAFKPDLMMLKEASAVFADETEVDLDAIIYCTGYIYDFPFLDESCGLEISKYKIYPLYQHLVNANYPTMFLINTAKNITGFPGTTLEAQYCVKALLGDFRVPSKEEMLRSIERDAEERRNLGFKEKNYHGMAHKVRKYYDDLSGEAGLTRVPPVVDAMHKAVLKAAFADFTTFRNHVYEVVDECTFRRRLPHEDEYETVTAENCTV